jgi:hypothetical protein
MLTLSVIWVDDRIEDVVNTWGTTLRVKLREWGIQLDIKKRNQGLGVREILADQGADLLILDINLEKDEEFPNVFILLERLAQSRISRPVVLFSGRAKDFSKELEKYRRRYLGAFDKSKEGAQGLAEFIRDYVRRPPVTAVVMSDLHVGRFVRQRGDLDRFCEHLRRDFAEVRQQYQVNHLILLGDFVWQGRLEDVALADELIQRMRRDLGLQGPRSVHFCPGNHDLARDASEPWSPVFGELVTKLAITDEGIAARYGDLPRRPIRRFRESEDLMSVGPGATPGLGFASLNSVDPRNHGRSRVGRAQLDALVRENLNDYDLRIALMHHPLYPAPLVGEETESPIPEDAARASRVLSQLGFQLLLTGHSHYSCVHTHELVTLNTGHHPPASSQRLIVVSLATLGGDPSPATPFRQYYVVRIGHQTDGGRRRLEVASRRFHPETETFSAGDVAELELGNAGIVCREPGARL